MSEAESANVCSLSGDLTHSYSPFSMETNSTGSDLPQVCVAYVDLGNRSQNALTQPNVNNISSFGRFEPTCTFQQPEAFCHEMIFQNLTEGTPCTEMPKLQSHAYDYAKDSNVEEESSKEDYVMETSSSMNNLDDECVRQLPYSPPHCREGTLKFTELSLDQSPAGASAFNLPQNFLYKESNATFSQERQNLGEPPETFLSHQEEAMEDPRTLSSWSPAGASWNVEAYQEGVKTPDIEESSENCQPLEEDMALNEVLRKLKYTNKKQEVQIQSLQCSNTYLEKKVKELQMKTAKQQMLLDIINQLKENVEELIEDKYRVMLEKNDTDKALQNLHEVLTNTQKHLQESRNERETLLLELKKIKASYVHLQERYVTEIQQKNETIDQCLEKERTLNKKEEEMERLQQLKEELEKVTTCTLDLLRKEKESRVQELLSLKEEFQKQERNSLKEKQELKSRLEKVVAQVRSFQCLSEHEKAKNVRLQEQINQVQDENARLQEQVARSEVQTPGCQSEIAQLRRHPEGGVESGSTKDAATPPSDLLLNGSPGIEDSQSPPDAKTTQLTSKENPLPLMDSINSDAEHFNSKEEVSDVMQQKLKSFHLKKKTLDMEVTNLDSSESKNIRDVPILLGDKLNEYHYLNEELDFLVSSYEEIIECADQRLEISHSHIVHLEERNKHLEDLIRRPRERDRKLRPRGLTNHPKPMTLTPATQTPSPPRGLSPLDTFLPCAHSAPGVLFHYILYQIF
ncbi:cancer-associated gene 1 protein [Erinaceus europaeus]|uniref:Cancer-associated gene 1 protein n=1 Tax=Erinaceus europaeus TaxID=9365 RepID=A0A1S3WC87_ERIEU|nr:cancer-associated gene 1 protein [Erinaceus europaeus]